MIPEKIAAYIPFDEILGESVKLVFSVLNRAGYETAEVNNPSSWIEEIEPTPSFVLGIFGERYVTVEKESVSAHWLSLKEGSFVEPVMRSASEAKIPIVIVLVRGDLSQVDAYADSTDLLYDVSSLLQPLVSQKGAIFFEAETSEQLATVIRQALREIEEFQAIEDGSASNTANRIESIAGSSVADVATEKDSLGFDVYVEAIGAYLTHEDTKGPLALSIEGEWGSGKSSFMLQLKKWLKDEQKARTVWFNAWRHDKEEALWAAFALRFVDEMASQMDLMRTRLWAKWQLMRNRFDWRSGWFDLVRTVFTMLLWVVIAVAIWVTGRETFAVDGKMVGLPDAIWVVLGMGGSLVAIRGVFSTIRDTVDIVGNPLRFNLKKHVQDLNYAERIGFIEQFHADFRKIVDVYAGDEKVYVFIDDLDRCEVPKAADMMQALNLMIGADDRLIFIVGMDRQKIAAGLAVKYENLLPYMKLTGEGDFVQGKTRVGTRFGYDFIEKFIQLPFRVPAPGPEKVNGFLESLKGEKGISASTKIKKRPGFWLRIKKWGIRRDEKKSTGTSPDVLAGETLAVGRKETQDTKGEEIEMARKWDDFALEVRDDSATVQEMVKTVAEALNYNPRRIKQFVNVFRLKAYIAYNTGQFNPPSESEDVAVMTFEQLAKIAAIELRWPLLIADLEDDVDLLRRLSEFAEALHHDQSEQKGISEPKTNTEERWRNETELMELIAMKANPKEEQGKAAYKSYSLTQLDITKLLQVSAKVTPPEFSERSPKTIPGPEEKSDKSAGKTEHPRQKTDSFEERAKMSEAR